ncbi:MAG: RidA family protein [Rhizobiales bacterium]|nr:RidA family protein [Hyphomicrobiales bacterium]MBO6700077.1 RidA family protein [Hyphomicrobiales bacterium]MBO6737758.1 RidA family protein [Hyphomicrobiales bacterium]MBO6913185.1 RidA family protein [Hyphomicrobiales bacterium]MBO6954229.1 RidA family protein [Hyphomicrobiales bacterium]
MTRKLISSGSPFEKQAGYSRALVDGDWVFVSGTTGYDYETMTMAEGVDAQARNTFATIETALQEAGASMADIVRVHYYITKREDAAALMAVAGEVLGDIRPAATLIICDLLEEAMLVEIEVTAKRRRG